MAAQTSPATPTTRTPDLATMTLTAEIGSIQSGIAAVLANSPATLEEMRPLLTRLAHVQNSVENIGYALQLGVNPLEMARRLGVK